MRGGHSLPVETGGLVPGGLVMRHLARLVWADSVLTWAWCVDGRQEAVDVAYRSWRGLFEAWLAAGGCYRPVWQAYIMLRQIAEAWSR